MSSYGLQQQQIDAMPDDGFDTMNRFKYSKFMNYCEIGMNYYHKDEDRMSIAISALKKRETQSELCYCKAGANGKDNRRCYDNKCAVRSGLLECDESCSPLCCNQPWRGNQILYNHHYLRLISCGTVGFGVAATRNITKNSFVIEYKGEVMLRKNMREESHYIMDIGGTEYVVDGAFYGSVARFVNNSHKANCYARPYITGNQIRLVFIANRRICVGEQLTICYGNTFTAIEVCNCLEESCDTLEAAKLLFVPGMKQLQALKAKEADAVSSQQPQPTHQIASSSRVTAALTTVTRLGGGGSLMTINLIMPNIPTTNQQQTTTSSPRLQQNERCRIRIISNNTNPGPSGATAKPQKSNAVVAKTTKPPWDNSPLPSTSKGLISSSPKTNNNRTIPTTKRALKNQHNDETNVIMTRSKKARSNVDMKLRQANNNSDANRGHDDTFKLLSPNYYCDMPKCGRSYKTLKGLKNHQKDHDKRKQCPNHPCQRMFADFKELKRHTKVCQYAPTSSTSGHSTAAVDMPSSLVPQVNIGRVPSRFEFNLMIQQQQRLNEANAILQNQQQQVMHQWNLENNMQQLELDTLENGNEYNEGSGNDDDMDTM